METEPVPQLNEEGEEEFDPKKMKASMDESFQTMSVVKEFEKDYMKFKEHLNEHDIESLNADVIAKTLNHCYKYLKEYLYQDTPNFDKEKMEQEIYNIMNEIKTTNKELNTLKGEFLSVSEAIINKDVNTLKLDQSKRALQKQKLVLDKFENCNNHIQCNKETVEKIEDHYFKFENKLFVSQIDNTDKLVEETNKLMQEIDD